jgi:hypothetical protein
MIRGELPLLNFESPAESVAHWCRRFSFALPLATADSVFELDSVAHFLRIGGVVWREQMEPSLSQWTRFE